MEANVFVKFLPPEFGDDELYSLFSRFGVIISAKVMVNVETGASLGYGFVRYNNKTDARSAILSMAGYRIGNKSLMCKLSDSFKFNDPCPNLYIKPLPLEVSEGELKDMFAKFGTIDTTRIIACTSIIGSNIGFVRYTDLQSANRAIYEMNGTRMAGQDHLLIVRYAESDSQRAVRKANLVPERGKRIDSESTNQWNNIGQQLYNNDSPNIYGERKVPPQQMFVMSYTPVMICYPQFAFVPQQGHNMWAPNASVLPDNRNNFYSSYPPQNMCNF